MSMWEKLYVSVAIFRNKICHSRDICCALKRLHKIAGFIKHISVYVCNEIYVFKFHMASRILLDNIKSVFEGIISVTIIFFPKDRLQFTILKSVPFLCCYR